MNANPQVDLARAMEPGRIEATHARREAEGAAWRNVKLTLVFYYSFDRLLVNTLLCAEQGYRER